MEDDKRLQYCTRCSAALTAHTSGSSRNIVFCAACEMEGRGPPFMSEYRNGSAFVDCDGHVAKQPDDVLHDSPKSMNLNCHGENVDDFSNNSCNSAVSRSHEPDTARSSEQLDLSSMDNMPQGSVTRLRKQAEMLANDEDIQVRCDLVDEGENGAGSNQFVDGDEFSLMKQAPDSSVSDAVLPSSCVDDSTLAADDVQSSSLPQFDECTDAKSAEAVVSEHDQVSDATKLLDKASADVKIKRRKRKGANVEKAKSAENATEGRCDCCSVLSHHRSQIRRTDYVAERKLLAACVGWLLKCLLLLLLLAVLLYIVCSVRPGWCRLGLLMDWRLRHRGGSPPV